MSDTPVRILLVEDNPGDARLVREALSEAGVGQAVSLAQVERLSQGLEYLELHPVDAILLDLTLPDSSGLATFYKIYTQARHAPVILLTGMDDEEQAQEVVSAGAQDYLVKGQVDGRTLMRSIRYAIGRKISEDNLRASEERYRNLIEQASDGIFISDGSGNFLDVNSSGCSLLGYSRAEILTLNMRDLVAPGPQPNNSFSNNELRNGKAVILEYVLLRKDGSRMQVEISGKILPGLDGRMQGIMRDVSARKQVEEQLQTTLQQLKFHVENSPLAVIEFDNEYRVSYWSAKAQDVFGWSAEEVLGKRTGDLRWVHEDDAQVVAQLSTNIMAALKTSNVHTNRNYRKDGTVITCTWYNSALLDADGKLISVQSLVLDITEHEQAAQALRDSHAFGQALLNNSPIGISVRDPNGRLLMANEAWKKIWAIPEADVFEDINNERDSLTFDLRDDYLKPHHAELHNVYVHGGSLHLPELKTTHPRPGAAEWVSQHFYAIMDEHGEVQKVVILTEDITERQRAELALLKAHAELEQRVIDRTFELQKANLELEKAARMKDDFLASMSHELRTPLTGILGLSEALQLMTYGEQNEKQLRALKNIETSGRHLLSLINDILDLSKIEAGMLVMQFAPTSLDGVCRASLQLTKGMASQKNQSFSFSIHPDSIILQADARRLKQMLVNLLGNAVKFTPNGGSLGIEVNGLESAQQVRITVWDTGIGIRAEDLSRLFQPFVQLDGSLSRQYAGTGLGLSLVKRMVEMHGGQIEVESVFGSGSRFTLVLPWRMDEM